MVTEIVHSHSKIDHTTIQTLNQLLLATGYTFIHYVNTFVQFRFTHTLIMIVNRFKVVRMNANSVCICLIEELSCLAHIRC